MLSCIAGHSESPSCPDAPDFFSRSDLAPFLQETRSAAIKIAEQLRQQMSAPAHDNRRMTSAQRHAMEERNLTKVADAFSTFKTETLAAGAASVGLHPLYHTKLEVGKPSLSIELAYWSFFGRRTLHASSRAACMI